MSQKPEPHEQELFRLAQELGEAETREEEPAVADWTAPPVVHESVPEETYQKAYKELTALLRHFQETMEWPKWQEPWWKQREKILTGLGLTVDGFYAELRRRTEAKKP